MDKDNIKEARNASRTEYLKRQTEIRNKAAKRAIDEKLNEIESGIVPESAVEAQYLLDRAREVQTADGLHQAAQRRQELAVGETLSSEQGPYPLYPSSLETHDPSRGYTSGTSGFVDMSDEHIKTRIETNDYVAEKTVDDLNREKAEMLERYHETIQEQRKTLPIYQQREALLEAIRTNQVVVIVGETGCGKTTQLLQYLYEEGFHIPVDDKKGEKGEREQEEKEELRLICTQPRRLAAVSVAERVAQETGSRCGSVVGYKVRFEEKTSITTRILFVTDGIMLKEFTNDPNLDSVGAIMIDEAHERSLNTDILLGLLRDVIRRNPRIKIIVASATINADKFSAFFNGAPVFSIEGRTFPVETFYTDEPVADFVTESAQTALDLHEEKPLPGDILIFLPGQDDIETCAQILSDKYNQQKATMRPLHILPLYASLPPKEQAKIYDKTPTGTRKVVIATNIAETSITIDGVRYVIDCGFCKQDFYNPKAMVEELRVVPTSQASAIQRAGRAGRTQSGECYRLYTPYAFQNELPPETIPEIRRCSMSSVVLQLKALGIHNLLHFDFLDPPSTDALERALDHLFLLGAMKADGQLTQTGRRMAEFPLDPSLSKSLIKACALKCGRHMAMAAAVLSLDSVFINTRDPKERQLLDSAKMQLFSFGNGDVTGYIRLMEDWLRSGNQSANFCKTHCVHPRALLRARDIMDQIMKTFDRVGLDVKEEDDGLINTANITKALLSGFFFNVSKLELDNHTYNIIRPMESGDAKNVELDARLAELHPTSFLFKAGSMKKSDNKGQEASIPAVLKEKPSLVVFTQLRRTTKRFMTHVSAILDKQWVLDMAPVNYFDPTDLETGLRKRPRM